jgi:hypothetical protein
MGQMDINERIRIALDGIEGPVSDEQLFFVANAAFIDSFPPYVRAIGRELLAYRKWRQDMGDAAPAPEAKPYRPKAAA